MDQRTDIPSRQDIAPGRDPKLSVGQPGKDQPWVGRLRARRRQFLIIAALIIIAVVALAVWWVSAGNYETTDDAFIDARTVPISSQVSAAIVDVPVTDNQAVEAGAVLVRLDDRDYKAQLDQAKAQVDQATPISPTRGPDRRAAGAHRAGRQAGRAGAGGAHLRPAAGRTLPPAGQERRRHGGKGAAIRVRFIQAQATFAAAQANAVATKKQLPVLEAQRKQADAQLRAGARRQGTGEANLSRTIITAPVAGRVTRLTAAKGTYAAVGQALMMFVPREVWVTANFKETQFARCGRERRRHQNRCLSRPQLQGPRRQHPGRQRHGVQPAARRERHRQFRQDRPARAGQDRVR